jgi:serine phosphatase RsbU (regulator of sigma subunit)
LPVVQQRINLLRGYFGQFLLPELMIEFFRPSYSGRAITVSETVDKRKLWMYPGQNFSVAVFISARILRQRIGPRLLVSHFNESNPRVKLGYFTCNDYLHAGLPKKPSVINRFKIEAKKFEQNAVSFRNIEDYLLFFRQVSPELIVFAYLEKQGKIVDVLSATHAAFASLIKWLFIALFAAHCWFLRNPDFRLSIQRKFLLLLFFANGIPALILFSTGYEYFNEKKAAMIDEQQQESIRILKEIDSRYPAIRKGFARQLNEFIDARNRRFQEREWTEEALAELKTFAEGFEPGMMLLLDRNEKQRITFSGARAEVAGSFFVDYLGRSLEFVSNNDLRRRGEEGKSTLESISSEDLIYLNFLSILNEITLQNTGMSASWTFLKLLGDFRNFNSWGIFAAIWSREDMLRTFIEKEFSKIEAEVLPRRLALMEIDSNIVMPTQFSENKRLQRMLHKAALRKQFFDNEFELNGKTYLFCAIAGTQMQEAVLMSIYPGALIDEQIARFKFWLFLVGVIILMVLWQLVRLFAAHMLGPVRELEKGVEQLQQRNFRYRIQSIAEDELGQLTAAFNSTMEGLQELAVGTAVQESLLPEEKFSSARISLFAKSLFMTKMGGDYFDYFESEPERIGIIFGDVAGHGIPAAVIMAMAKAVVASTSLNFKTPAETLLAANQVLLHLKEKKLRRMMTCQCLDIDSRNGKFSLANAGHCYPVHIKQNGSIVEFIEANGLPLGNKLRNPYDIVNGQLASGDVLVLYTDGIIEAINQDDEMFDYRRFVELLKKSFDKDLESFWQKIIAGNRQWAVRQDDDLTFMLIRYE